MFSRSEMDTLRVRIADATTIGELRRIAVDLHSELERARIDTMPHCEGCGHHGGEAWPCPSPHCDAVLHLECGHGLDHEPANPPYGLNDAELVVGQWHCHTCGTLAGLDTTTTPAANNNVVALAPARR